MTQKKTVKKTQSLTDIISMAIPDHKALIEANMDVLMEDLAQQELLHQTFFGTSYMNECVKKMCAKRGFPVL